MTQKAPTIVDLQYMPVPSCDLLAVLREQADYALRYANGEDVKTLTRSLRNIVALIDDENARHSPTKADCVAREIKQDTY
jgi:hypothetical protein